MNKNGNEMVMRTELLCKSFVSDGKVTNVIKNLDLEVKRGDYTVIMGSSGSGKSTLLYMLSGMLEPTKGEVWLEGEKINGRKEKEMAAIRRTRMGFVFQAVNLIPDLNIRENIMSPAYHTGVSKEALEERLKDLSAQMEITDTMKKFPGQLSGGQRQRAAICRALMNKPDIVFADEPTGALNSAQGESVLDIFSNLHKKEQSVVMVTHDLKAAVRGNRIIYLRDGRIDGDLHLNEYDPQDAYEREQCVYEFLKERGW